MEVRNQLEVRGDEVPPGLPYFCKGLTEAKASGHCAASEKFSFEALTADFSGVSDENHNNADAFYLEEFHKRKKTVFGYFSVTNSLNDNSVNDFISHIGHERKFYVTTPYRNSSCISYSDSLYFGTEIRNRSELGELRKVRFEGVQSEFSEFDCDIESLVDDESDIVSAEFNRNSSVLGRPVYSVTELFDNLELKEYRDKGVQTEESEQPTEEINLIDDVEEHSIEATEDTIENEDIETIEDTGNIPSMKDISEITMSKEARFAIIETLQDMKSKGNQENLNSDIRNKGVTAQKRLQNNRVNYNKYKTIAESKNIFVETTDKRSQFTNTRRQSISRYKSLDSEGGTAVDDYSSAFSSELNTKETDGSSSAEEVQPKRRGKLFPSINNKRKSAKRLSSAASKFYTLEKAKMTNYRIPGIGKFELVASPDSDFRITPVGFDSRYDPQPIIYKEERELPPSDIQEKSIQKCKKWLKNVHLSPLSSLQPVQK